MSGSGAGQVRAFDWQRLLLGEDPSLLFLLELVFRTGIIFLWLLYLLRMTGKRGLAQLSPLELAIVIALGSAAGDPMLYAEVPLLHAMLVLSVVIGVHHGVSLLMIRRKKIEAFIDGSPLELVRRGVILDGSLERANLTREDLFERLRLMGIEHLGQVRRGYFEQAGSLSVFQFRGDEVQPGLPIVPPWDLEPPVKPPVRFQGLVACQDCGRVQSGMTPPCVCGGLQWAVATRNPWSGDDAVMTDQTPTVYVTVALQQTGEVVERLGPYSSAAEARAACSASAGQGLVWTTCGQQWVAEIPPVEYRVPDESSSTLAASPRNRHSDQN